MMYETSQLLKMLLTLNNLYHLIGKFDLIKIITIRNKINYFKY